MTLIIYFLALFIVVIVCYNLYVDAASQWSAASADIVNLKNALKALQASPVLPATPYNVLVDYQGSVFYYNIDVTRTGTWINTMVGRKSKYESMHIAFNTGVFYLDVNVQVVDQSFLKISGQGDGFISGVEKDFGPPPNGKINVNGGLTVLQVGPAVTEAFSFASSAQATSRFTGIHIRSLTLSGPSTSSAIQHGLVFVTDNDACSVTDVTIAGIAGIGVYNFAGDAFRVSHCQINELGTGVALVNCIHCAINDNLIGAQPIARATTINGRPYASGFDGILGKDLYLSSCEYTTVNSNLLYPNGWSIIHAVNAYNTVISSNTIESYYVGAVMLQACTIAALSNNVIRVPGDRHTNTDIQTIGSDTVQRDASFGLISLMSCTAVSMAGNVVYCPPSCKRILNLTGGANNAHSICSNQLLDPTSPETINVEGGNNAQIIIYDNLRSKQFYSDVSQDQSTLFR